MLSWQGWVGIGVIVAVIIGVPTLIIAYLAFAYDVNWPPFPGVKESPPFTAPMSTPTPTPTAIPAVPSPELPAPESTPTNPVPSGNSQSTEVPQNNVEEVTVGEGEVESAFDGKMYLSVEYITLSISPSNSLRTVVWGSIGSPSKPNQAIEEETVNHVTTYQGFEIRILRIDGSSVTFRIEDVSGGR